LAYLKLLLVFLLLSFLLHLLQFFGFYFWQRIHFFPFRLNQWQQWIVFYIGHPLEQVVSKFFSRHFIRRSRLLNFCRWKRIRIVEFFNVFYWISLNAGFTLQNFLRLLNQFIFYLLFYVVLYNFTLDFAWICRMLEKRWFRLTSGY
jgi:hypothetical protein